MHDREGAPRSGGGAHPLDAGQARGSAPQGPAQPGWGPGQLRWTGRGGTPRET